MRKANKQTTGLLPQERFLKLLNEMVDDMDWHPFEIYGEDYHFSYSDNPEFPYRLTYTKHDKEFHIDLSESMIFEQDSSFLEELLCDGILDEEKINNDIKPRITIHYKKTEYYDYIGEDAALTWYIFLQKQLKSNRLRALFNYLIEE